MNHSVIFRRRDFSCVRNVFFTSCWVSVLPPLVYSLLWKTLLKTAALIAMGSIPGCS